VLHDDRSPDDSKIKQKMLYASSKDALRKSLVGISSEIQGTDLSEVAHETGESRKEGG
jgi:cofilin